MSPLTRLALHGAGLSFIGRHHLLKGSGFWERAEKNSCFSAERYGAVLGPAIARFERRLETVKERET